MSGRGAWGDYSRRMFRPAWEPDFDFYETHFDASIRRPEHDHNQTSRVTIFLDLAAKDHAPLASHPMRLQVRVAMQRPNEDGLRAEDEAEALFAVEDAVAERVIEAMDALYVGRVTAEGYVTFAFYFPAEKTHKARELSAILGGLSPYLAEWRLEEDAAWAYYLEFLYPDEELLRDLYSRRARDRVLAGSG